MWAHVVSAAIGIWLMAAPAVIGFVGEPAAFSARIAGPYVATFSICAWWQVLRNVRWANTPAGIWLVIAPIFITHGTTAAVNSVTCGLAIAALSFVQGKLDERYGGRWQMLWRS